MRCCLWPFWGMTMLLFLGLMIGLEIKHCIADYFLQPGWILAGKGDWRKPGGYAHAGVHAGMTAIVLLIAQTPLSALALIVVAEFIVHYALDYAKIAYSAGTHVDTQPSRFWALHGIDQLAHQITYAAIIYAAALSMGLA